MKPFDAYEVHGVAEFGHGRNRHSEQVPDSEAQYWSLFGHTLGEGLECIGDFQTRREAESILARITGNVVADELPSQVKRHLPPDPEQMNDKRADWASQAIGAFLTATKTDLEDTLCDLLCDLMHWADRFGFDFDHELQRSRDHYQAETCEVNSDTV